MGRPKSVADISRATHIPQPTVSREIERLKQSGLLKTQRVGRAKLVDVDSSNPYFPELQTLVLKAAGPAPMLARNLKKVKDVEAAFLFGSWARRYSGEPGKSPADIDVLVLGDPYPDEVDAACRRVERKLEMEVNPVIVLPKEWDSSKTGFIRQLKRQPLIPLFDRSTDGFTD
jgi:predicted nucleotidyltransferase